MNARKTRGGEVASYLFVLSAQARGGRWGTGHVTRWISDMPPSIDDDGGLYYGVFIIITTVTILT